ncbi:hypothetical protein PhCBS80983_g04701 [Powellomyces hirtus]|uniref:C2H2-type domain-containing protein n=1 Tax=Powellomyces hirtus TaxID=109895 RepID=A0A507DXG6_9FUNG|nr:hypothetical protein PhCBS80983_g04701 [Powellomyces hirtus]
MPEPTNDPKDPFRVLILGDGNFSFSAALCHILWPRATESIRTPANAHVAHAYLGLPFSATGKNKSNVQITTTSFDDRIELFKKYPETRDVMEFLEGQRLKDLGVRVFHGVNAWQLHDHFGQEEKFNAVIWNHPHLGTEDFRLHRFLMAHFFSSVASVLSSDKGSCVCVSLVEGQETRWDIVAQATRSDLGLAQVAVFDETLWPGYVVKRNKHGGSFKNMHTKKHTGSEMKSHLFRFEFGSVKVQWQGLASTRRDKVLTAHAGQTVSAIVADSPASSDVARSMLDTAASAQSKVAFAQQPHVLVLSKDSTPSSPAAIKPSRSNAKSRRLAAIPKDLKCPHCEKQLDSARGYTQHVHMVHILQKFGASWTPGRDRTTRCLHEGCGKIFRDERDLWQHGINKHSTVSSSELPSAVDQLAGSEGGVTAGDDYDYVPCETCGQAVVKRDWGMQLHLETLKPAVGMDMKCPLCEQDPNRSCNSQGFIESRALFQHYKFCRQKRQK